MGVCTHYNNSIFGNRMSRTCIIHMSAQDTNYDWDASMARTLCGSCLAGVDSNRQVCIWVCVWECVCGCFLCVLSQLCVRTALKLMETGKGGRQLNVRGRETGRNYQLEFRLVD